MPVLDLSKVETIKDVQEILSLFVGDKYGKLYVTEDNLIEFPNLKKLVVIYPGEEDVQTAKIKST